MASNEGSENLLRNEQALEDARRNLEKTYRELGIRTHELIADGKLESDELLLIKMKIDALNKDVDSLADELEQAKPHEQAASVAVCSKCGGIIPPGMTSCPQCNPESSGATTGSGARTMACPACEEVIHADSVFCGMCGTSIVVEQELVSCVQCGERIDADSTFCGLCGGKIDVAREMISCIHCGMSIDSDSTFCVLCGGKIDVVSIDFGTVPAPAEIVKEHEPIVQAVPEPPSEEAVSDTKFRRAGQHSVMQEVSAPELEGANQQAPEVAPVLAYANGAPIPEKKTCKNCGATQRPQATFCLSCGEKLPKSPQ